MLHDDGGRGGGGGLPRIAIPGPVPAPAPPTWAPIHEALDAVRREVEPPAPAPEGKKAPPRPAPAQVIAAEAAVDVLAAGDAALAEALAALGGGAGGDASSRATSATTTGGAAAAAPAAEPRAVPFAYLSRVTHGFNEALRVHAKDTVFAVNHPLGRRVVPLIVKRVGNAEVEAYRRLRGVAAVVQPILVATDAPPPAALPAVLVFERSPFGTVASVLEDADRRKKLNVRHRVAIARQLVAGLLAMHRSGHLHHDVKSDNAVLTAAGARLIDVAAAKEFKPATRATTGSGAQTGTPGYMCPDYAGGLVPYGEPQEVFAAGVVLLELATGRVAATPAYRSLSRDALKTTPPPVDPDAAAADRDTLERLRAIGAACVANDPSDRPSMQQVEQRLRALVPTPSAGGGAAAAPRTTTFTGVPQAAAPPPLECAVCYEEVAATDGACCTPDAAGVPAHFLCVGCLERTVLGTLQRGHWHVACDLCAHDARPGTGELTMGLVGRLLSPTTLHRWGRNVHAAAEAEGEKAVQQRVWPLLDAVDAAMRAAIQQPPPGGAGGGGGGAAVNDAAARVLVLLVDRFITEGLALHCPSCGQSFEWTGCAYVGTCPCGQAFCGLCLVRQPCVDHAPPREHYFATDVAEVRRYHGPVRQRQVDAFLRSADVRALDAAQRAAFRQRIERTARDNGVNLNALA